MATHFGLLRYHYATFLSIHTPTSVFLAQEVSTPRERGLYLIFPRHSYLMAQMFSPGAIGFKRGFQTCAIRFNRLNRAVRVVPNLFFLVRFVPLSRESEWQTLIIPIVLRCSRNANSEWQELLILILYKLCNLSRNSQKFHIWQIQYVKF